MRERKRGHPNTAVPCTRRRISEAKKAGAAKRRAERLALLHTVDPGAEGRREIKKRNLEAGYTKIGQALKGREFSAEHRAKISERAKSRTGGNNPAATAVRCIETGEVYATQRDAALAIGIGGSASKIGEVCRGNRKSAGGYHWEWA